MPNADSPLELIEQARAGDRTAVQQLLWRNYGRLVHHVAHRLAGNLQRLVTVEDVVQETFIQAIRDIGRCQARSDESFGAWLKAIADHRLHDIIKGLYRRKRGGDRRQVHARVGDSTSALVDLVGLISDNRPSPSGTLAQHEAVQAMQVGIAGLPSDQREAIRLRYLEGKSLDEAAAELGRTAAAVNGLVRRAKEALRRALDHSSRWLSRK
jgi:RNA polymerase sigma-70 factor (ECF subfamily)